MDKLTRLEKPLELPHVWVGKCPTHNYPQRATFKRPLLRLYRVKHSGVRKWQNQVCALRVWGVHCSVWSFQWSKVSWSCSEIVQNCPGLYAWTWRILSSLKLHINRFLKVELKMWQRGVGCNPCVCQGGILCVPCVDPHSWPELPTWWGGTRSWSSNFCFHISLGGHTQVWLEPGTSASVLSPKERSCGGWRLLPNLPPALFCLSCQISLRSLPQRFGPGQVILVPPLLLGKQTHVQPSVFEWLFFPAACFPSGSLSSHHPSRLALPCLPVPAFGLGSPGCPQLPGRALPWHGHLAAPGCLFPSHPATHLLLPLCFFFLFTLCGVWSNKSCHPSPFCLQLPPAVPGQWIYL